MIVCIIIDSITAKFNVSVIQSFLCFYYKMSVWQQLYLSLIINIFIVWNDTLSYFNYIAETSLFVISLTKACCVLHILALMENLALSTHTVFIMESKGASHDRRETGTDIVA